MISKVKTLVWYLKRPKYYSQLFHLVKHKVLQSKNEKTRGVATQWCKENAISNIEAIKLFTEDYEVKEFRKIFPEKYQAAGIREKECPFKMGGEGDLTLIYHLCEIISASKVIETGVAYGWSSFAILASLQKRNGKLISTDMPYAKMGNESFVGVVIPNSYRKYWELIREPDRSALPKALREFNQEIDLCHYDSDKTYEGRMFAYPKLWEALKPGGFFISDDINDNLGFHDFCLKIKRTPVIVAYKGKYIGIIKK